MRKLIVHSIFLLLSVSIAAPCFAASAVVESSVCVHPLTGRIRTAKNLCPKGYLPMTTAAVGGVGAANGTFGKQGSKGSTGVDGLDGDKGAPGVRGQNIFDPLPSLKTVTGSFGKTYLSQQNIPGDVAAWSILLPINAQLSHLLEDAAVGVAEVLGCSPIRGQPCIDPAELQSSGLCTGSYTTPTAPPGKVCIYPSTLSNVTMLRGNALRRNGFEIEWRSVPSLTGRTEVQGSWAYTAP